MAEFTGHTPGPWEVKNGRLVDGSGKPVVFAGVAATWGEPGSEADANRDLAAAAPSLLARAEAAEERVRVLEAALEAINGQAGTGILFLQKAVTRDSGLRIMQKIKNGSAAALATTGVQHG